MKNIRHCLKYLCMLFAISLAAFAACSSPAEKQQETVSMDKFAYIYSQAVILHQNYDSLSAARKVDSLLAANGWWLQGKLETTVAQYQKDQTQWQEFWALVVQNLEREANPTVGNDSTETTRPKQK
ncbi:MAG: hypothetical protein H6695_19435 [Deferribacteres bacterium]|nr:hypothetical protein [candidate division KSB1 bacterium]MCB9512358.1 hypothetical protein [Deferribacteres bacterium]